MGDWITASPNPVYQGQHTEISYDFVNSRVTGSVKLTVYNPPNDPFEVELSPSNPSTPIQVPANCTGITVVDESGHSTDLAIVVLPA